jgi:proteasome lid subunit RPN8/RPN11
MSDAAFETWGVEQSAVTIEYSLVVLEEIRHQVSQGLLKFSRGGIEVGGILYGSRDGRKVRVESIRAIECDHARGPTFTLSPEDRTKLEAQLAGDAQDAQLQGLIRVGWFVSHTRGELAMTETDLEIFSNYFRDPWQVTLVIRPGRGSAMRAAFFVWEQDGTVRGNQSYKEFSFPDRLAGVIDAPSRAERAESRAGFRNLPPLPTPPVRVDRPRAQPRMSVFEGSQYYPSPVPHQKRWPWIVGILAVVVVIAIFSLPYLRPLLSAATPEPLGLAVTEREGQLQIQWNNASRTVIRATSGSLDIVDGITTQRVPLTRLQLSEGVYVYTRQGGDVEVRMEVQGDAGESRESTRFLGRPPAPEVPDATVQLEAEKAKLEKENARLKSENATLRERAQALERTNAILQSRLGITGK